MHLVRAIVVVNEEADDFVGKFRFYLRTMRRCLCFILVRLVFNKGVQLDYFRAVPRLYTVLATCASFLLYLKITI